MKLNMRVDYDREYKRYDNRKEDSFMNGIKRRAFAFLLALVLAVTAIYAAPVTARAAGRVSVYYSTHVLNVGWQGQRKNGEIAGTEGKSLRLEGIRISLSGDNKLGIRYTTHVQSYGWMPWSCNGETSGTAGESKRLEAIKICLTGENAKKYDVYYRVHAQVFGWLNWAKNGEAAGTAGFSCRLEGIQICVVSKGQSPAADYKGVKTGYYKAYAAKAGNSDPVIGFEAATNVLYSTHVQQIGWQAWKNNGGVSGTFGQSLRLEGIKIQLSNKQYSGNIYYRTHVQSIGWQGWVKNGAVSGTQGRSLRLEAIQMYLSGELAKHYDLYYRTHTQGFGWLNWVKNGNAAGTAGFSYRLEGIQIVLVKKGAGIPGNIGGVISANRNGFIKTDRAKTPENPYKESTSDKTEPDDKPKPEEETTEEDPVDDEEEKPKVITSHNVLGTFGGIRFAEAYTKSGSELFNEIDERDDSSYIRKKLYRYRTINAKIFVNKVVDERNVYIKYNGNEGYRDIENGFEQFIPDFADPVVRARITYEEIVINRYTVGYRGDRLKHMKEKGYKGYIYVSIGYIEKGQHSFDLYYKNKKIKTIKTGDNKDFKGGNGFGDNAFAKEIYSDVVKYKKNMTDEEILSAAKYWVRNHSYEEGYDCWCCHAVGDIMKMLGYPVWVLTCYDSKNHKNDYSKYYMVSPFRGTGTPPGHRVAVCRTDKEHYCIIEAQGAGYLKKGETDFSYPWEMGSGWYLRSLKEKSFPLRDYDTMYELMIKVLEIDADFDAFNCKTGY